MLAEEEMFDGHIDLFCPPNRLIGWAMNVQDPETGKLTVSVKVRGQSVGSRVADGHRRDLERFGSGKYAFDLECSAYLSYAAILIGDVTVHLSIDGREIGKLLFSQLLRNIVSTWEVGRLLNELSIYDAMTLKKVLAHATPHLSEPAASAVYSAVTVLKNRDEIASFTKHEPGSFSNVAFKTGIISSDGAAMLGQEGHIFLIEGNNNIRAIFDKNHGHSDAVEFASRWDGLIKRRRDFVRAQGAAFLQMVIPEKISLMREWMDGYMSSPSATLSALEDNLSRTLAKQEYVSGIRVLSALPFGTAFRKVDSHIVPAAAFALFKQLCRNLDIAAPENVLFDVPVTVRGDLARRFFGHELYEVCMTAKEPLFKAGLKMISSSPPLGGGYIGKRSIFQNPLAPIRKKAVLFGNSFFDNHVFQGSISYWMAIWFQEYHFIFTPEMDNGYVTLEKPDIVICQTIERFLELVPGS